MQKLMDEVQDRCTCYILVSLQNVIQYPQENLFFIFLSNSCSCINLALSVSPL